ncbi:HTH-type transcriptional repressor YvoA [Paraglaciecola mesophila]|uniref:HTH-type transcriptional repressor YvoA n=1 Tax=Paraglaciecola mesophila TaxID=197222 RepID=A0A857JQX0_9ALTE|nr:GntR family transcriptional regulator [Paraglaciecola mesophila]QHJ13842.1 HTH-type transcriptional repressor YvoA [Paraglaciecola mesophila]
MTKIKSKPSKHALPLYQTIGETLINQILSGDFALNTLLPTEKQLCEQFSISRHTAREALRYVEKTGLVERKQGSGTLVKRNTMPEQINQFINSVKDLLAFGQHTRFEVQISDMIVLDEEKAALLDTSEGQECIHIGGIRIEPHDKKPICYSHIYRRPHLDQVDEMLKDTRTAIYAVIEALDDKKIGKIEQQISACLLPEPLASQLAASPNSAAMKITRRYYSVEDDDLILVAQSIYPAKRFSFTSVLFPNK